MKPEKLLFYLLLAIAFFCVGCKKERSCESCQTNKSPIAVAGTDQIISLPTNSIFLDGSASNDPDGSITTWQWSKVAGPALFTIANTGIAKTQVNNLAEGTYLFELKVTDAGGSFDRDTMQVIVDDPSVNQPPVANAGADTAITLPANIAMLDGSSSADPDNNITSYQWTKIQGPVSSTITNASGAITTASSLTAGIYLFELKVTDAGGLFDRDTVLITVFSSTFNGSGVFIVGWGTNASGKTVARIWRDSVLQDLSDGQYDAEALSVFVSGNDIYVAGWELNANGKRVANLWKNGVVQNLSDGQNNVIANSVYVANTDVYVAGFDGGASIYYGQAILWKNGVAQNLVSTQYNGEYFAEANSVFVSGSDVYVAGYDADNAKLWKNGVAQNFGGGDQYAEAHSVVVSGNVVYVAGTRYPCAVGGCADAILWENGQPQILQAGDASAHSVFVSNNVYVGGNSGSNAVLWKNGIPQNLGSGSANSVFVSGNDVYAVGNSGNWNGTASLWKNGIEYSIPGFKVANSVFVQ